MSLICQPTSEDTKHHPKEAPPGTGGAGSESRRDQEEGGELDSHEEVSPEEIKRRKVSWTLTKKLAQKRSRAERWCWAIERESWTSFASQRRGSVLHSSWDSNCRGAVVAAQCRTDTALTSCCSGGGPRQPWSSGLAPVSRFQSSVPLFHGLCVRLWRVNYVCSCGCGVSTMSVVAAVACQLCL